MKLSTKIRLFSSLFMLVLILLVNTSIYFLFYKISVETEMDELTNQTNEITRVLNSGSEVAKNELLRAYIPTAGMIRVIKENGDLELPTLTKKREYTSLETTFVTSEAQSLIKDDRKASFAMISKPIVWENGSIVTLEITKQLVGLTDTMQTLFYVLIAASIIMLIPTIVAGAALSRFILKPIRELTFTMNENIQASQWKKINADNRSGDELYEMKKTFNTMIDNLKLNYVTQEIFVSDASHELKTPISIIKSYSQLLARRGQHNPEIFNESIHAIESEADRMQNLVEQMLLLANNQEKEAHELINIVNLCTDTAAKFNGAYNRSIILKSVAEVIYVIGNRVQLQQVVYILIDNALKYSEDQVKLNILKESFHVLVSVRDFGRGIPQQEQPKIFNRFYRIDKSRSRESGGTGLGLAIAKTIAQEHEGSLSLSSTVGEGSTFTLALPIDRKS